MVVAIDECSLEDRFLHYAQIDTQSDDNSNTHPSTPGQTQLLQLLRNELLELGISNVELSPNGYLQAHIPGRNCAAQAPRVGFLAHVDTSPDAPGANVSPQIVASYDGGDIFLKNGSVLSPTDSPELRNYTGQRLIVTDGNTLLGADDKAGVAAITEAIRFLQQHPELPHAPLSIAFTSDEEIGRGVDLFDIKSFGADFAYTIDGGKLGELAFENFHAARADITFRGINAHPGDAKGKMLNAIRMAIAFDNEIGANDRPECTSGREGFFHLHEFCGTTSEAHLNYLIRELDSERFYQRKQQLQRIAEDLNQRFPNGIVTLRITDQYPNMLTYLAKSMFVVERALDVFREAGITPDCSAIRGGTDGVRLTELGLTCPNIFAGGHNFHSVYEFLPVRSMTKACEVIVRLAHTFSQPTNR